MFRSRTKKSGKSSTHGKQGRHSSSSVNVKQPGTSSLASVGVRNVQSSVRLSPSPSFSRQVLSPSSHSEPTARAVASRRTFTGQQSTFKSFNSPIFQQQTRPAKTRLFSTKADSEQDDDGSNSHGAILMKSSSAPRAEDLERINALKSKHEDGKRVKDSSDTEDLGDLSDHITPEELFRMMPPLEEDMFALDPRQHASTLIWLPDSFEPHSLHTTPFQMLMPKNMRVLIPSPPKREVKVKNEEEDYAWFDIQTLPYSDKAPTDYEGLKVSMYQLHQLFKDEALRLGEKIAPLGSTEEIKHVLGAKRLFVGGFGQGAAAATFAALRYPYELGGVISHSGFIPFISETVQVANRLVQQHIEEEQKNKEAQTDTDAALSKEKSTTSPIVDPTTVQSSENVVKSLAPNLKTPLLVLHNYSDNVIPWAEFAQQTYIQAVSFPLRWQPHLRMSRGSGHTINSTDLLDVQFWINSRVNKIIAEQDILCDKIQQDLLQNDISEYNEKHLVLRKISKHLERVEMPTKSIKMPRKINDQMDLMKVRLAETAEFVKLNSPYARQARIYLDTEKQKALEDDDDDGDVNGDVDDADHQSGKHHQNYNGSNSDQEKPTIKE